MSEQLLLPPQQQLLLPQPGVGRGFGWGPDAATQNKQKTLHLLYSSVLLDTLYEFVKNRRGGGAGRTHQKLKKVT